LGERLEVLRATGGTTIDAKMDSITVDEEPVSTEFARKLEESYLNAQSDPFDVIEQYGTITSQKAISIGESADGDQQEFVNFELEARLWSLVNKLFQFRQATLGNEQSIPEIHSYSSNAIVQERFLRLHPSLREHWIILQWLQDSLVTPSESTELRTIKWMYTKNLVNKNKLNQPLRVGALVGGSMFVKTDNSIITELDADAPLRTGKRIAAEDESFDKGLFKYIFELLQMGKYQEALRVCHKTGNFALKLGIAGHNEYIDPEIDGEILDLDDQEPKGTQNKPLWRYMCWQLAQQASGIDVYERGIYGLLSGDLDSVLGLCHSWETQFVTYMAHICTSEADKALLEENRLDPSLMVPQTSVSSAQQVLDILAHSANPEIKQQSQNLVRIMIGSMINGTVDLLANRAGEELARVMEGRISSTELTEEPHVLRILTHLVLFLSKLGVPAGSSNNIGIIVRAYIEHLQMEGHGELVPLYICFLPEDMAIDTYSFVLANVSDPEKRKFHLKLGRKFDLDVENTVRAAVQRVFDEIQFSAQDEVTITSNVEEDDLRLYRAAEWYVEARMWADAVHSTVVLYRKFLISGKIGAAVEYGKRNTATFLLNKHDRAAVGLSEPVVISDNERAELIEYQRLVDCLETIEKWSDHFGRSRTGIQTEEWRTQARDIVDELYSKAVNLTRDWLIGDDIDAADEHVRNLRIIYVPYVLLRLMTALTEAQKVGSNYIKMAVHLANLVAEEEGQLYRLFMDGGYMEELLDKLATAFTDGIARGEQEIYE
jgi:nuclear pore complex protein Nup107